MGTSARRRTDTAVSAADAEREDRLRSEPLTVLGRFATASNVTLLCRLGEDGPDAPVQVTEQGALLVGEGAADHLAVYKPRAGEAPLWDFPDGTLHRREVATSVVARALGWDCVPLTVERTGPHGVGSVQRFVDHDPQRHYFALVEGGSPGHVSQLRRMVVLDLLINNADRKGGHVLLDGRDHVWLVDHGVTFHHEPKLRTVAWDFAGEPVPADLRSDVAELGARLSDPTDRVTVDLGALLAAVEVDALRARAAAVVEARSLPHPQGPRPYPWPLL